MSVDNETSSAHSMMTLRCRDRKGLLYDLFRSLKDIDLRCVGGQAGRWGDCGMWWWWCLEGQMTGKWRPDRAGCQGSPLPPCFPRRIPAAALADLPCSRITPITPRLAAWPTAR